MDVKVLASMHALQAQPNAEKDTRNTTGFLNLPLEIRNEVYRLCLPWRTSVCLPVERPGRITRPWGAGKDGARVMRLCKQINHEAMDVLYGENSFEIHINGHAGDLYIASHIACFNKDQLSRIREVEFVVQSLTGTYGGMNVDSARWGPFLSHLTKVTLTAKQPVVPQLALIPSMFDGRVRHWFKWFDKFVLMFAEYIPKGCTIRVDYDGKSEIRAVLDAHLENRYQVVETSWGCKLFKRGKSY